MITQSALRLWAKSAYFACRLLNGNYGFAIAILILAAIFQTGTAFGLDAVSDKDGRKALPIQMNGHEYDIPVEYILRPPAQQEPDIFLLMALPDMHSATTGPDSRQPGWASNGLGVLVSSQRETVTFAVQSKNMRARFGINLRDLGRQFGLNAFTESDKDLEGTPQADLARRKILYLLPNDDNFLIVCDGDKLHKFPSCEEVFLADGLLINARFAKSNLEKWEEIRSGIQALLISFKK